jgi:hypothetical protein
VLGIRLAVAHALENHRSTSSDSLLWPDRFILERLAGLMFVSTDAFEESFRKPPPASRRWRPVTPATTGSPEPPLITIGVARARKMNPVELVSKEVAAGGKCR